MAIISHQGELFHYRGREEFKDNKNWSYTFTPTDEIEPLRSVPLQSHIYGQSGRMSSTSTVQGDFNHQRNVAGYVAAPSSSVHEFPAQHNVFNEHIKANLEASRLQMGSSAFRSVIDGGSTSPTRPSSDCGVGGLVPGQNKTPFTISHRQETSSDMNPFASNFTPSFGPSSTFHDEIGAINMSLCKALTTERDAHITTKEALQYEMTRRTELENEITRLTMSNKSLISSVQMLGSIIKHNTDRTQTSTTNSESEKGQGQQVSRAIPITRPESRSSINWSKNDRPSILYDALSRQRAQYEGEGYPDLSENAKKDPKSASQDSHPASKDHEPFNLKLLQSPDLTSDAKQSALTQTLRKHFLDFESAEGQVNPTTPKKMGMSDQLIEITPETLRKVDGKKSIRIKVANTLDACRKAIDNTKAAMYPPADTPKDTGSPERRQDVAKSVDSNTKDNPGLATTPILQLPQFLLDKYRRPQTANTFAETPQSLTDSSMSPSRQQGRFDDNAGTHAKTIRAPFDDHFELSLAETGDSEVPCNHGLKLDNSQTSRRGTKHQKRNVKIASMPYSITIDWKISDHNAIFDGDDDVRAARNMLGIGYSGFSGRQAAGQSSFWSHPIRYLPNVAEKNIYRTVMIDFMPLETTYQDVLKQIRTGALESIQLFPPIGNSMDFATARIIFHYELSANQLCMQDQKYGTSINGKKVRVWQVTQPTYPKNADLEHDVFEACYTRMLLIDNITDAVFALAEKKLALFIDAGLVIDIGHAHDGVPMIEFTNVSVAVKAMRQLVLDPDFGGAVFDFENDPCDTPYTALETHFQRNGRMDSTDEEL